MPPCSHNLIGRLNLPSLRSPSAIFISFQEPLEEP